jgi:hypothetical protein
VFLANLALITPTMIVCYFMRAYTFSSVFYSVLITAHWYSIRVE